MEGLTVDKPKCLVKIYNETILERQLKLLKKNNIKRFIITTGPFQNQIRQMVKKYFFHLNIKFVFNKFYKETNYIYSLFLVQKLINDNDILLLHGDLVFNGEVLSKLLETQNNSTVLIDKRSDFSQKDFNALVEEDKIKKIGIELSGNDVFPLQPFYKFKNSDFRLWLSEISKFIEIGKTDIYAENALNNLLKEKVKLIPTEIVDGFCQEVDTKEDLEEVKMIIMERKNESKRIFWEK